MKAKLLSLRLGPFFVYSLVAALVGCAPGDSKSPGIDLGASEIRWADKNEEQRFGYMAAQVHPVMQQAFAKFDKSYKTDFKCETCHGRQPELVDYKMPSEDVYALPKEDPIGVTMEDDEDLGNFMMGTVTPALQKLFDKGQGSPTKVTCFTCHPVEDD